MNEDEDPQREKIFELEQEIVRLRGQITYLQEELSSAEDEVARVTNRFEYQIDRLEQDLGDALYRREE
jgi:predicted  nucleic acid-binding Zn-ribbon protein